MTTYVEVWKSGGPELVPLTGERITVGRAQDNDVVLPDSRVSAVHALLERLGPHWSVRDLGSRNGTTRLEFLDNYDTRFVIVTQGPIDEALAYKARVGNKMTWYSTANSPFGADMGAPPGGGFQVNVFLRAGDTVYRTYNTQGRGTEQLSHSFALIDLLPYGRQEEWQDSPEGWPQSATYSRWASSESFARYAERT